MTSTLAPGRGLAACVDRPRPDGSACPAPSSAHRPRSCHRRGAPPGLPFSLKNAGRSSARVRFLPGPMLSPSPQSAPRGHRPIPTRHTSRWPTRAASDTAFRVPRPAFRVPAHRTHPLHRAPFAPKLTSASLPHCTCACRALHLTPPPPQSPGAPRTREHNYTTSVREHEPTTSSAPQHH